MTRTSWTRWFELNRDERRWMRIVTAIFLVGLIARTAYDNLPGRQTAPDAADSTRAAPDADGRGR